MTTGAKPTGPYGPSEVAGKILPKGDIQASPWGGCPPVGAPGPTAPAVGPMCPTGPSGWPIGPGGAIGPTGAARAIEARETAGSPGATDAGLSPVEDTDLPLRVLQPTDVCVFADIGARLDILADLHKDKDRVLAGLLMAATTAVKAIVTYLEERSEMHHQ
jgi:hypothetical protein